MTGLSSAPTTTPRPQPTGTQQKRPLRCRAQNVWEQVHQPAVPALTRIAGADSMPTESDASSLNSSKPQR